MSTAVELTELSAPANPPTSLPPLCNAAKISRDHPLSSLLEAEALNTGVFPKERRRHARSLLRKNGLNHEDLEGWEWIQFIMLTRVSQLRFIYKRLKVKATARGLPKPTLEGSSYLSPVDLQRELAQSEREIYCCEHSANELLAAYQLRSRQLSEEDVEFLALMDRDNQKAIIDGYLRSFTRRLFSFAPPFVDLSYYRSDLPRNHEQRLATQTEADVGNASRMVPQPPPFVTAEDIVPLEEIPGIELPPAALSPQVLSRAQTHSQEAGSNLSPTVTEQLPSYEAVASAAPPPYRDSAESLRPAPAVLVCERTSPHPPATNLRRPNWPQRAPARVIWALHKRGIETRELQDSDILELLTLAPHQNENSMDLVVDRVLGKRRYAHLRHDRSGQRFEVEVTVHRIEQGRGDGEERTDAGQAVVDGGRTEGRKKGKRCLYADWVVFLFLILFVVGLYILARKLGKGAR